MSRVNRDEIFADDEIQVFHLVNRVFAGRFCAGWMTLRGETTRIAKSGFEIRVNVAICGRPESVGVMSIH